MITFDFDYYKPDSVEQAVKIFKDLSEQGKTVMYYAGGTEIISRARLNKIRFDAVIDIKGIPECNVLEFRNNKLVIGAAVTLTIISDSKLYPFLSAICRRSANHTARGKITIGGNICGKTPYKEAVLPLIFSESDVVIAGANGYRIQPIKQVFNNDLLLSKGEFLVQIMVDKKYTDLPYANSNKIKHERIAHDYRMFIDRNVLIGS